MKTKSVSNKGAVSSWRVWLCILVPTLAVLTYFFFESFRPGHALFANDGPIGVSKSRAYEMPGGFIGIWLDGYWFGGDSGSFPPNFYGFMRYLFGPVGYVNFSVPVSLLVLGLCAGLFFRTIGCSTAVCSLGALAAALNTNFFSNACWGLPSRATGLGMAFLALAALHSSLKGHAVIKTILAGLAIGMSISESGDNGALFAMFIAAHAFFLRLIATPDAMPMRALKGMGQVALMAVCAALLTAQTLQIFVNTSIKGMVVSQTEGMSPEAKWNWATQWSLPKKEMLRVIIPGLFGYRMDTPEGGNYWGGVGQEPSWPETKQGFPRHSGAGEYAGILVVLIAAWGVFQSARRNDSVFSPMERKLILFWLGALIVAAMLSWGRHGPFYYWIYKLPFFSTIRNPMKFMHPGHLCILVLFGYGLQGIWRSYLSGTAPKTRTFEKKWMLGSLAAVGVSFIGLLVYSSYSDQVAKYLTTAGFDDLAFAKKMAQFSVQEVLLSVVFLAISVVTVLLIQNGTFAGPRAKWAAVLLGAVLVVDLGRADKPWIKYFNYQEKYVSNPVLDILANKPWERRVAMAMSMSVNQRQFEAMQQAYRFTGAWSTLQQIYQGEWMQHQFPFYDIHMLESPQEPRLPADKQAYLSTLNGHLARLYELTSTRYVLGLGGNFADALNTVFDPAQRRFRPLTAFEYVRVGAEGVGTQLNPAGNFSVVEFTGALPRVKLYNQWEVNTNGPATLARLVDPGFNPQTTVLIGDEIAPPPAANANVTGTNVAEFISNRPKHVEVRTASAAPGLLLFNDKIDAGWKVWVDQKPAQLVRANFLARGVLVPAGEHQVTFRFQPRTFFWWGFWIIVVGFALLAFLIVDRWRSGSRPAPVIEPGTAKKAP